MLLMDSSLFDIIVVGFRSHGSIYRMLTYPKVPALPFIYARRVNLCLE